MQFSILNIGLDRDLLSRGQKTEAQARQCFYAHHLPARQVHLVKAPYRTDKTIIKLDQQITVIPCPVVHWVQFCISAFFHGISVIRKNRIDVIQVQEPFVSGLAGALLSRLFHVPLVVGLFSDEIDNPVWLSERRLNRWANVVGKWVLRQASAIRSDSQAVVNRLSSYHFRNLSYVPFLITHADCLLETASYAPNVRAQLLEGQSGPLLLSVSRLEHEKNIPLLLEAVQLALKQHPGLVLAMVGHGSLEAGLKKLAEKLLPGKVRWLGWVPNDQIPAYYQAADLTLLGSNRESAARVLIESLLAGTAVLTTDTAGAADIVQGGEFGRVVPVGDVGAFAEALVTLCRDRERLEKMGKAGRCSMQNSVTGEAVVNQLRQILAGVAKRSA